MQGSLFMNSRLSYSLFNDAHMELVDFSGADLSGSFLENARFFGAQMRSVKLKGVQAQNSYFVRANLFRGDLVNSHFENSTMTGIHLEKADLDGAHFNNANLQSAHLEFCMFKNSNFRSVNLSKSHLQGALFFGATLDYAKISAANIKGTTFTDTSIKGADFANATTGPLSISQISEDCILDDEEIEDILQNELLGKTDTMFKYVVYLPQWREYLKEKEDLKNFWKHIKDRWSYTDFTNVNLDQTNTVMAKDLYRYANDQQFLQLFKIRLPWIHFIWKIFSYCGGRLSWVAIWSSIFVVLFALMYWVMATPVPEWLEPIFPQFLMVKEFPINPLAFFEDGNSIGGLGKWVFISFDIFSNLG